MAYDLYLFLLSLKIKYHLIIRMRYPPYTPSKIKQSKMGTTMFRRTFITKIFENPIWVIALAVVAALFYKNK